MFEKVSPRCLCEAVSSVCIEGYQPNVSPIRNSTEIPVEKFGQLEVDGTQQYTSPGEQAKLETEVDPE